MSGYYSSQLFQLASDGAGVRCAASRRHRHASNSCWNDVRERFDRHNYMWCPRHLGTDRHFECTRLITATQVDMAMQRIPGFGVLAR
jgi:hypothetical protein